MALRRTRERERVAAAKLARTRSYTPVADRRRAPVLALALAAALAYMFRARQNARIANAVRIVYEPSFVAGHTQLNYFRPETGQLGTIEILSDPLSSRLFSFLARPNGWPSHPPGCGLIVAAAPRAFAPSSSPAYQEAGTTSGTRSIYLLGSIETPPTT